MSWMRSVGKTCGECYFEDNGKCLLKHIEVKQDRMACAEFDQK